MIVNASPNLIFNQETGTILLTLKNEDLNLNIVRTYALAENLLPKHEFHITIIGKETGELSSKANINYQKLRNLAELTNWSFTLNKEFYFITKIYIDREGNEEKRSSIIQTVKLPSLSHFYGQLNQITKQEFAVPFPHVTLFTNSTKRENVFRGIGIYSLKDMENMSPRKIELG